MNTATIEKPKTATPTTAPKEDKLTQADRRLFVAKERVLEHHFGTFKQAGEALLAIREKRLYRETYSAFDEYCRARWDMSKTQANRLIAAAQTVVSLETPENAEIVSRLTEGSVRPLTTLTPETQKKVVAKLVSKHPKEITAKLVQDTARQVAPKEVPRAKTANGEARADLVRRSEFIEELAAWEKTHKANGTFEKLTVPAVLQQVRKIINGL